MRAHETASRGGSPAPRARGRQARPGVDHRARFATLTRRILRESDREAVRRAAEDRALRALARTRRFCVARARHHASRAVRRVRVQRRVRVTERYRAWEQRPVRETFTTRVHFAGRWRTVRRSRVVMRWRPVTRTRTGIRVVTRTVLRRSPRDALLAGVYGRCASRATDRLERTRRVVDIRRSRWEVSFSHLERQAWDSWKILDTRCRVVGRDGVHDIQRCEYGAWRGFGPGGFTRRVVVRPPRPPDTLVREARDSLTPPAPEIRMSPRVEWEQIVHLPTWLWVDEGAWRARTARADAGRAWAEAKAVPARVVWDMGNGDTVTCRGPGTPYDESRSERRQRSDCTYTYEVSSEGRPGETYRVTATIVYDVSWSGSADSGGDLGTISRSAAVDVRVAELQAVNI